MNFPLVNITDIRAKGAVFALDLATHLNGKDPRHDDCDAEKVANGQGFANDERGNGDAKKRVEEVEAGGAGSTDAVDEQEPD